MEFDFAHAAVAAILVFITGYAINHFGGPKKGKWDWRIFFSVFVVMLLLNLIWPY